MPIFISFCLIFTLLFLLLLVYTFEHDLLFEQQFYLECAHERMFNSALLFAGNMLAFLVGSKQAFEISLADVSQTQLQGKNDVMLEFHVDDTTGANEVTYCPQ